MAGGHGKGVTYKGVTIHPPATWHVVLSEVLGGLMWSWLMIRVYHDGHGLLYGHAEHFDHELHEMAHNHHGHNEEEEVNEH